MQSWSLIRRVPVKGDRHEYFEAETDVWEMFIRIAMGRKEREINPATAALKSCLPAADADPKVHAVARKRLKDMEAWHAQVLTVPKLKLAALIRLGARIVNLLPDGKAR